MMQMINWIRAEFIDIKGQFELMEILMLIWKFKDGTKAVIFENLGEGRIIILNKYAINIINI